MTLTIFGLLLLGIALGIGWLLVLACSTLMDGLMGDDDDSPHF